MEWKGATRHRAEHGSAQCARLSGPADLHGTTGHVGVDLHEQRVLLRAHPVDALAQSVGTDQVAHAQTDAVAAVGVGRADAAANLAESLKVDLSGLKSQDGQPLLLALETKPPPPRPKDPDALPETDPGHWYDMEYAGWNTAKENIPTSPKDGAIGKRVIAIINGDHPYLTAYSAGM